MVQMIMMMAVVAVLLAILNSLMGLVTDSSGIGGILQFGSDTVILFFLFMILKSYIGGGSNLLGVPFLDRLEEYGSMITMFQDDLPAFLMEMAQLISLATLIGYVSKMVPADFGGSNFSGKILRSAVLIIISVFLNDFLISAVKDTPVFAWGLDAIKCLIAGTAMTVTPAILLANFLNLPGSEGATQQLAQRLTNSKFAQALSAAANNSVVWVAVVMIFEKQYGSVVDWSFALPSIMDAVGPLIIMAIGIYAAVSIFRRR